MTSVHLIRAFKSLQEKAEVARIEGNLPDWVTGNLLRACPGLWDFPDIQMVHLYDGYTMLCKFEVNKGRSGTVSYSSKFIQSEAYRKAIAAKKPVIAEFCTKPAASDPAKKSVFAKVISSLVPEQTDNCPCVSFTRICSNPILTADTGFMFELDKKSLECLSRHDSLKELGVHTAAAHLLTDSITGDTYNVGISLSSFAKWVVLKFPAGCERLPLKDSIKRVEVVGTQACRNKMSVPWFHAFGMTQQYVVVIDQPCYFNCTKVVGSFKPTCPMDSHEWKPEQKNQFYLFHKTTRKFMKTNIVSHNAFFYHHVLNCYEKDNHVVIDLIVLPDFHMISSLTMTELRKGAKISNKDSPRLVRYIIPLCVEDLKACAQNRNLVTLTNTSASAERMDGKVVLKPEILCPLPMDYCTFNERFRGPRLRYVWGSGAYAPSENQNKILKFDLQTRKMLIWKAKDHIYVGEPSFIPNPNSSSEDDGIIVLVLVNFYEPPEGKDSLVFLDAKTLKEVAKAEFNAQLPISFHSTFISE